MLVDIYKMLVVIKFNDNLCFTDVLATKNSSYLFANDL